MSSADHEFWTTNSNYTDLAKMFEQNIEITHPNRVTSNRLSPFFAFGEWGSTAVTYREYRGETV